MGPELSSLVTALVRSGKDREIGATAEELARMHQVLDVLRADYPAVVDHTPDNAIQRLRQIFELTDLDLQLLVAGAAADLDANLGLAISMLGGRKTAQRPSVGLAMELCGVGSRSLEARSRLSPQMPLLRWHLAAVEGDVPFLARQLRIPDRVVAHILGDDTPDPVVDHLMVEGLAVNAEGVAELAEALRSGSPMCYVHARPGTIGLSIAVAAFAVLTIPVLAVDLRRRSSTASIAEVLRSVVREAGLLGRGLIVVGVDVLADTDPHLLEQLAAAPIPVLAIGAKRWSADWLRWLPMSVDAPFSTSQQRRDIWMRAVVDIEDGLTAQVDLDGEPASGWAELFALNISPEEIGKVVDSAALEARAGRGPVTLAHLRDAARRLGGASHQAGMQRREPNATFDDLILPAGTFGILQELVGWGRHREAVLAQGPITGKGGKGRGIVALFTGSPGTGKTLAAQVVADSLGLDLQSVDLSAVVDKYIGETEKNLERVFQQAENLNCVLLFDEADALFGSRSEVRDARDRYANQEVAYLLQRLEQFDGIAILATNLRGNLDAAFSRRLHFIIPFPDPDAPTRRILWQSHLASVVLQDPADPVDIALLGDHFELAGGDIRNVVMTSTFNAATRGELLGMRHVRVAIGREYSKLARMIPAAGAAALGSTAAVQRL